MFFAVIEYISVQSTDYYFHSKLSYLGSIPILVYTLF